MKKKLALLMAAIMTVAMVPMTAFASTKLTAVDEISVAKETNFTSTVELSKNDDQVDVTNTYELEGIQVFDVQLKLTNGKFAKNDNDKYLMEKDTYPNGKGVVAVDVKNDTTAVVSLNADVFNGKHKDFQFDRIHDNQYLFRTIFLISDDHIRGRQMSTFDEEDSCEEFSL